MKILNIRTLSGPNYWTINHRVIEARLDIEEFEDIPSDKIDGFFFRMQSLLPGLEDHHCSEGKPGGFLSRVKSGTWIGHIVEHIALELQSLANMPCYFGKTRSTEKRGIYNVVISYDEERSGIYALNAAVAISESLARGVNYDVSLDIENLKKIAAEDKPGPSTMAIINAAKKRGIPQIRLAGSLIQLGYGCKQRRIDATITDNTSCIAVDLASDKQKTRELLSKASIPVPEGRIIYDLSQLQDAINEIGYPLVMKPYNGNQGKGIHVDIRDYKEAEAGFESAREYSNGVIVEEFIPGKDYRLLVINFKLVAAACRFPAFVTGNSISTVKELVDLTNKSPERGIDHENILTRIKLDESTLNLLSKQNISLDSVPEAGRKVMLKQTANLSQGGIAEDVSQIVHPEIAEIAERAARIIGLDVCGIDLMAQDISSPLSISKATIIEVNAAPGFRMHTNPTIGLSRPVGEAVVNMLFGAKNDGRIPITAITGTNGKTTTARLLAHIARHAGYSVGLTTTEGIYINNTLIEEGDCTGLGSTRKILHDRIVNFAVLECARGGILRNGLGFDFCNTAIVTNVAEDHLGLNGIETVEDMAHVKAIVPETVLPDGLAILNENNEYTFRMKNRLKCSVAFFSINGKSSRLLEHCRKGGIVAFYQNGFITLMNGRKVILTMNVADIPLTFNGRAPFMIENTMAAVIAAYFNRIDTGYITEALRSFTPSFENAPGRLNKINFRDFDFILDYAHNMHGIEALGQYIRQVPATQKTGIITAPGDRRESDIIGIGKASAEIFNRIIIRIDDDPRGRKPAEIADLLRTGIRLSAKNPVIEVIEKEYEAILHACSTAVKNSLIVLLSDKIKKSFEFLIDLKNKEEQARAEDVFKTPNPYVLRLGKNNVYMYTKTRETVRKR